MKTKSSVRAYKNKEILITGGLGFIGSNLAKRLVALGARVMIVDSVRPSQGGNLFNIKDIQSKVRLNISDIRNEDSMNELVKDKDIIFNLAGTLSHVESMQDPYTDLSINTQGQITILEACRRNNPDVKIVYAGTRNQYGRIQYLPVDENHPSIPTDTNSINRMAGEQYHMLYFRNYGIKCSSLRIANTYGPGHQMKHPRQGVLNWFIRQIIDGEAVTIFGTGKQVRDTNFVDDVVDAFLLSGMSNKVWGKAYNLGGNPISLREFVEKAIKVNRKGKFKVCPEPEERKNIEIGDYIADFSRIKKDLNWEPKVSFEVGLRKTFAYYKKYKKHYW